MEFLIAVLVLGVLIIAAAVGYNDYWLPYAKDVKEKQDLAHKAWLKKIDDEIKEIEAANKRASGRKITLPTIQKKSQLNESVEQIGIMEIRQGRRIMDPSPHEVMRQRSINQMSEKQQDLVKRADRLFETEMAQIQQQIQDQKELNKQLKIEALERELKQNLGPVVKLFNGEWKDIREIIELVKKHGL